MLQEKVLSWTIIIAAVISLAGLVLWLWLDTILLPRRPAHYLKYSLIVGLALAVSCFAGFTALAMLQGGEKLLPVGILLSCLAGFTIGIGTAISYGMPKVLRKVTSRSSRNEARREKGDEA